MRNLFCLRGYNNLKLLIKQHDEELQCIILGRFKHEDEQIVNYTAHKLGNFVYREISPIDPSVKGGKRKRKRITRV